MSSSLRVSSSPPSAPAVSALIFGTGCVSQNLCALSGTGAAGAAAASAAPPPAAMAAWRASGDSPLTSACSMALFDASSPSEGVSPSGPAANSALSSPVSASSRAATSAAAAAAAAFAAACRARLAFLLLPPPPPPPAAGAAGGSASATFAAAICSVNASSAIQAGLGAGPLWSRNNREKRQ
jgi:hypothetical protein